MIRFYSNENFHKDFVEYLRKLGNDVITSFESGNANKNISDEDVMKFAIAENRAVITMNRQDFLTLHKTLQNHEGIVICKEDIDDAGQAQALQDYLSKNGINKLTNRCLQVKKKNQPKSNKKIFIVEEVV